MTYKLRFYPKQCLVVIYTYGFATFDGFVALATDLLEDANWVRGMTILIDHSKLNFGAVSTVDVDNWRDFIRTNSDRIGPSRIATIVQRILDYDLVRMWEIPLEDAVGFEHRVFSSIDDAKTWLGIEIDDEP